MVIQDETETMTASNILTDPTSSTVEDVHDTQKGTCTCIIIIITL